MIWEYSSTRALGELLRPGQRLPIWSALRTCAFCKTVMSELHKSRTETAALHAQSDVQVDLTLYVCPACGWWNVQKISHQYTNSGKYVTMAGEEAGSHHSHSALEYLMYEQVNLACGSLKQLDVSDASIPMRQLEAYLMARYSERYRLTPRRFEELVAAVFGDFGFTARVTSFSGDDGIDVVLFDGPASDVIGVQVKRSGRKVKAEQIRSFVGALHLNGMPQGVYVTTSSYTRGARKTRDRYLALGVPIELVDSQTFYDCLRVKRRAMYSDPFDPSAPWHELLLHPQQIPNFSLTTDVY